MQKLGMAPEAIDAISPLQAMLAVMMASLKAGDHDGALAAAVAAAPNVHPKLASADVRVTKPNPLDWMTDEELAAEAARLKEKIRLAHDMAAEQGKVLPFGLKPLPKKLLPH
jgi:hypothetical protein